MLWINGSPDGQISAQDRGLLYGDACFTTLAKLAGRLENLDAHLARLQRDAQRLLMSEPDVVLLRDELTRFAERCEDGVIRCTLTRGIGGNGYALPQAAMSARILHWRSFHPQMNVRALTGISVRVCRTTLAVNSRLAGIKHSNRLEQILARAEWTDESIAEGLMMSQDGDLVEATSSNVFWRDADGQWHTPVLDRAGVEGVMRSQVLQALAAASVRCQIDRVPAWQVLAQVQEWFVCNSVIGVWPIVRCAEQTFEIGDTTRQLQQAIGRGVTT